ncbi:hypothetical protein OROGR_011373 [Orobanche gracilis]
MDAVRLNRSVPVLQPFYSGGPFVVSSDGSFMACAFEKSINIVDSTKSTITSTLDGDSKHLTVLALSVDDKLLFSSGSSLLVRAWDLSTLECIHTWEGFKDYVHCMACHPSGRWLATGGNEGKLRLFDVDSGSYTHGDEVCRQCVSYVMFHPNPKKKLLFSTSGSGYGLYLATVEVWVISTGKKMKQIATVDNMCSPLTSTSIAVSEDGNTLLSAGRDQTWPLPFLLS